MATDAETSPAATPTGGLAGRWTAARPWVSLAARLGLAGVLGYAGLSKVGDPAGSVRAVEAYELLGDGLATAVGYALPFFELALAVLLLLGLATRYAGAVSGLLMLAFIAGIASAWARGLSIDCGCFGDGGPVPPGEADYVTPLLRDVGFLALATIVTVWPGSPLSVDRLLGTDRDDEETYEQGDEAPGA